MNGKNNRKKTRKKTAKKTTVAHTAKKATDTPLESATQESEAVVTPGEAAMPASPRPQTQSVESQRSKNENKKNGLSLRLIEVPTATLEEGYVQRTVNIGNLSNEQAIAMCSIRQALNTQIPPARLEPRSPGDPGKIVESATDAVRWLLEQVADEMGLYDE